jgi:hypothetical protein
VSAAVKNESHSDSAGAQPTRKARIRLEKRIVAADIDPDRDSIERAGQCKPDQVMSSKILRVIECAGGRVCAPEPERRRVCAYCAEAFGSDPHEVKSPETAHRNPSDCHAVRICV